ncbi:MAG: hypothetical protein Q9175_000992 [Cornicularia normoerica]
MASLFKLKMCCAAAQACHGALRDFASREIEDRKTLGSNHQDILAKLWEIQKQRLDETNDANVLSMATSNISAGSDVTAISTSPVIYRLLKNPECKRKLVEQIDSQMREAKSTKPVTLEQTKHMPYLQACLYEGLRLHPAVGMSLPRVTPPGGAQIDGRFIPEGTTIGANPWVVCRNFEAFGDYVEAFRPERWLKTGDRADMDAAFLCFVLPISIDKHVLQRDSSLRLVKEHVSVLVGVRATTSRHPSSEAYVALDSPNRAAF